MSVRYWGFPHSLRVYSLVMRTRKVKEPSRGLIRVNPVPSTLAPFKASPEVVLETFFKNLNPKTVRAYGRCLMDLQEWMEAISLPEMSALFMGQGQGYANMTALKFKDFLGKEGYSPSSVNVHLTAMRSLVKTARTIGLTQWTLDVKNVPNQAYKETQGPGTRRFQEVWEELRERTDPIGIRDRAILALVHDAGLRRDEIESIDMEHIDWLNDKVLIRAKKKTSRVGVPMNKDVQEEIKKWIKVRGEDPGALFKNFDPAGKGKRFTGTSIGRMCNKYGLGHIHGIRHLAITEALELTNGNIVEVMKFSRHSDPKTVMIYDDNLKNVSGEISSKLAQLRKGNKAP